MKTPIRKRQLRCLVPHHRRHPQLILGALWPARHGPQIIIAVDAYHIARRLEFHHTPKHRSWLNMAETELSVFSKQYLKGVLR